MSESLTSPPGIPPGGHPPAPTLAQVHVDGERSAEGVLDSADPFPNADVDPWPEHEGLLDFQHDFRTQQGNDIFDDNEKKEPHQMRDSGVRHEHLQSPEKQDIKRLPLGSSQPFDSDITHFPRTLHGTKNTNPLPPPKKTPFLSTSQLQAQAQVTQSQTPPRIRPFTRSGQLSPREREVSGASSVASSNVISHSRESHAISDISMVVHPSATPLPQLSRPMPQPSRPMSFQSAPVANFNPAADRARSRSPPSYPSRERPSERRSQYAPRRRAHQPQPRPEYAPPHYSQPRTPRLTEMASIHEDEIARLSDAIHALNLSHRQLIQEEQVTMSQLQFHRQRQHARLQAKALARKRRQEFELIKKQYTNLYQVYLRRCETVKILRQQLAQYADQWEEPSWEFEPEPTDQWPQDWWEYYYTDEEGALTEDQEEREEMWGVPPYWPSHPLQSGYPPYHRYEDETYSTYSRALPRAVKSTLPRNKSRRKIREYDSSLLIQNKLRADQMLERQAEKELQYSAQREYDEVEDDKKEEFPGYDNRIDYRRGYDDPDDDAGQGWRGILGSYPSHSLPYPSQADYHDPDEEFDIHPHNQDEHYELTQHGKSRIPDTRNDEHGGSGRKYGAPSNLSHAPDPPGSELPQSRKNQFRGNTPKKSMKSREDSDDEDQEVDASPPKLLRPLSDQTYSTKYHYDVKSPKNPLVLAPNSRIDNNNQVDNLPKGTSLGRRTSQKFSGHDGLLSRKNGEPMNNVQLDTRSKQKPDELKKPPKEEHAHSESELKSGVTHRPVTRTLSGDAPSFPKTKSLPPSFPDKQSVPDPFLRTRYRRHPRSQPPSPVPPGVISPVYAQSESGYTGLRPRHVSPPRAFRQRRHSLGDRHPYNNLLAQTISPHSKTSFARHGRTRSVHVTSNQPSSTFHSQAPLASSSVHLSLPSINNPTSPNTQRSFPSHPTQRTQVPVVSTSPRRAKFRDSYPSPSRSSLEYFRVSSSNSDSEPNSAQNESLENMNESEPGMPDQKEARLNYRKNLGQKDKSIDLSSDSRRRDHRETGKPRRETRVRSRRLSSSSDRPSKSQDPHSYRSSPPYRSEKLSQDGKQKTKEHFEFLVGNNDTHRNGLTTSSSFPDERHRSLAKLSQSTGGYEKPAS